MNKLFAVLAGLLLSVSVYAQEAAFDYSGAWYDPETPGWGLMLDPGAEGTFAALFAYTFQTDAPGQAWYVGYTPQTDEDSDSLSFDLNQATGEFPAHNFAPSASNLQVDLTPIDADHILVVWAFVDTWPCVQPSVSPRAPWCEREVIFTRLLGPSESDGSDE